jgi:oligosaccharide reducing-end xylanase
MSDNKPSPWDSSASGWRPVMQLSAGLALLLSVAACHESNPNGSEVSDGTGAYATGKYRNLFAEAGRAPVEIRQKIDAAFQQLFHGSPETQTLFYWAGTNANGPLAFITDIKHEDVRTEGLSYGMMITVQMDRKAEFDALWNWSKTFLYHDNPNHPSYGFFSWQARTNGTVMSEYVAPDGEEYYVTALYFAAHRWGSGQGIYNYRAEADRLLGDMRHRRSIIGDLAMEKHNAVTNVTNVTAGPLFDEEHKMVLFTPSSERARFTDPSYHLPAFYELWARWGPVEDRPFWAAAAAASRDYFSRAAHPVTALTPDYSEFDGTPVSTPWHTNANSFGYDAFRTAGNWSVDWSWWAKDTREQGLSDKLQAFFKGRGMADYGCRFTLDGKEQLDDRHAQGLAAVNAVASLAATQPQAREFVEALWNSPIPDGLERYYEGLLYMMGLLHCSGEFRIWMPN